MRSYWALYNDWYSYKQTEIWTQREDSHVNVNAENGITLPQAKNCWQPPEDRRGKEGTFPRGFRGNAARLTLDLYSTLQNSERINFCFSKPHSL